MTERATRLQPLTKVPLGEKVLVAMIRFDNDQRDKLASLGLRTGSEIRVIQRSEDGPFLVAIADNRIALDYEMARKIMISPIES